jgi:Mg-chelatase subunit ChlD
MNTPRRSFNDPTLMLLCAMLLGCSAGVKATQVGTGGSSGGSVGSGGAGASGHAGTTGAGGSGTGTSGTTGTGNTDGSVSIDGACAAESVGAVAVPLDLYFVMDSSKSMADNTGAGTSKWAAVGSALGTFFNDAGSAGLGIALKYFPDEQAALPAATKGSCTVDADCMVGGTNYGPCDRRETCTGAGSSTTNVSPLCLNVTTDCPGTNQACALIQQCSSGYCAAGPSAPAGACSGCTTFPGYCHLRDICTTSKYATPDVALMTLPAGAAALSASLTGHMPDGYTPTGPALAGAITYAKARLASNPDRKVAVVLVTDGLPGGFLPGFPPAECMPSDVATIGSSILAPAATANPPILTFVVGIFNKATQEGMMAPTNLATLATAGGTVSPVIIDVTSNTVTQQLHDALQQAQTKAIACSYSIPPSTGGRTVDFGKVNVQYTSGGTTTIIKNTTGMSACSQGGWYYDSDPAVKAPTQIIACPSTCAQFNADTSGHVDIVLGCMTITVT